MNYRACYERLIERARTRDVVQYTERHHIIPRCLGGTNARENIARLTAEEHYVAHQLLVKMYPSHPGLLGAALMMSSGSPRLNRSGNKAYGWLRRRFSARMKAFRHTPETRESINAQNRQKVRTPEFKAAVGAFHTGRKRPPETGQKISKAQKQRFTDPAQRTKLSLARHGVVFSDEHREKLRRAKLGRKLSEETKLKMRGARGPLSEDHKRKISESKRSTVGA